MKLNEEVKMFLAEAGAKGGRIGGKSKSKIKLKNANNNLMAARKARWKGHTKKTKQ